MSSLKWLCLMPHPYGWGDNQGRDIGALANGLRQLGENVDFYVMDESKDITDPDVRAASHAELSDPQWWQRRGRGIFLTTFGTSLLQPIYRAAKQAGWTLWARMDCDGIPGPDGEKRKYLTGRIVENIDRRRRKRCDLSATLIGTAEGAMRAAAGLLLARRVRRRLFASYELIGRMLVETEMAHRSFTAYFNKRRRPDLASRVFLMPPAVSETFRLHEEVRKGAIIAVGQWFRWQKNMPLLAKTIAESLAIDPNLKWMVVGNGVHYVQERLRGTQADTLANVRFYAHTSPQDLAQIYSGARTIFYSSRQEGFPNTLCEALCSGASFVAPRGIQAFEFCESRAWGTLYNHPSDASAALFSELDQWNRGARTPLAISEEACALFHRKNVAARLCRLAGGATASTK
jgi:glycosyltransferase involved in cell wall biosynthesis